MNIVIETERLILRTFTEDDGSLIYELNKDPDVTEYTGDPVRDIEHACKFWNRSYCLNMHFIIMGGGLCM